MRRSVPVSLRFDPCQIKLAGAKDPRAGLSAAAPAGRNLWVLGDEGGAIERLTRTNARTFANHRCFPVRDLLGRDFPAAHTLH